MRAFYAQNKSASQRGYEEISYEKFCSWLEDGGILRGRCQVTGLYSSKIIRDRGNKGEEFHIITGVLSPDRIDNNKGYEEGNVHGVLPMFNMMRGSYGLDDTIDMCIYVAEFHKNHKPDRYEKSVKRYKELYAIDDPCNFTPEQLMHFKKEKIMSKRHAVKVKFHARENPLHELKIVELAPDQFKLYSRKEFEDSTKSAHVYDFQGTVFKTEAAAMHKMVSWVAERDKVMTRNQEEKVRYFISKYTKLKREDELSEEALSILEGDF